MKNLTATISSDIDTLSSIYKGKGCRRQGGYSFAELRIGLENFTRFLEPYDIKATLFMVGNDFKHKINHSSIQSAVKYGHEIANHSLSHIQGFKLLSAEEKEKEIKGMEDLCREVTGIKPIGFRAPGWNISDDTILPLKKLGYKYDSSIHPTSFMPLLKLLHWKSMSDGTKSDRTTMGHLKYIFASTKPYKTSSTSFFKKGKDGIIEFPVTVTPILRIPFFATFLLSTGINFFKYSYKILKLFNYPIQFQFHLSDFVDYTIKEFQDQMPDNKGVYIPKALLVPLSKKIDIFKKAIDIIAKDYNFSTLNEQLKKNY